MDSLLSLITFLPLIGAVVLLVFLRGEDPTAQQNAKLLALFTTTATFLLSLFVLFGFDPANTGFQFVEERPWIGGLTYKMGVDGISVLFVMLTTFLMPLVIAASWNVETRVKEYMVAFLVLETLMIGVFCALDLVLFYIFFEGGLIPMFLIIGIWGGKERIYASFKFFLYTFFGSVLMLVAMIAMYMQAGTTDIPTLMTHPVQRPRPIRVLGFTVVGGVQTLMFLAFFASFAVKMPMWPVHTWLPDAHVQAPTAGSVVLAAILLKMGGYGFLRFSLPMFPVASELMAELRLHPVGDRHHLHQPRRDGAGGHEEADRLFVGGAHGLRDHGDLRAEPAGDRRGDLPDAQPRLHLRRAVPRSSGVIYDRMHTREIAAYGGLVVRMPLYALIFMLFTMGNVGLPGTSGFVGEFLTLAGVYPGQHLGRVLRGHRGDPLGLLCALALPAGGVRRPDQGEPARRSRTSTGARS